MNDPTDILVLVACEESQRVTIAFRKRGFTAFSCDIQDCTGGYPNWHIHDDVRNCLYYHWDLIIAHPPCTYISNAGARWLFPNGKLNHDRWQMGIEGVNFFNYFLYAQCDHIAIENPIPSKIFGLPHYTQIIQPYEYGEPWSKKTCLWLKGLPHLQPTNIVKDHKPYCTSGSYSKTHDPKYKGASRKGGSAKSRSKTFLGIAEAMAEQWGNYLLEVI